MDKKKTAGLITSLLLLVISVLFIISYSNPSIVSILVGSALLVAFITLTVKGIIEKGKVLTVTAVIGVVLLTLGIVCFAHSADMSKLITNTINYGIISFGGLLLIDSIVHFFKKRSLAPNIIEIILGGLLILFGILGITVKELELAAFIVVGVVGIIAALVLLIATFVNFNKYLKNGKEETKQIETQKSPHPQHNNKKSNNHKKSKKRK